MPILVVVVIVVLTVDDAIDVVVEVVC